MSEWFQILLAMGCGCLLGLLYFGGLWWTVSRLETARSAVGLYLTSLTLRTGLLLLCLFLLLQLSPAAMLVALAGFFLTRVMMVRRFGFPRGSLQKKVVG